MTAQSQASPRGAVTLALGDGGLAVRWAGIGRGVFWIGGRPVDLRAAAAAGNTLTARLRVDAPPTARVQAGVRCASGSQADENGCGRHGGAMLDVTQLLGQSPPGSEITLTLPLACFSGAGHALAAVAGPLELRTEGKLSLRLTDIRFARVSEPRCHPGVAVAEK